MSQVLEFDNYTPDRFVRLTVSLAAKGLKIVGDSGEIEEMGADVVYSYSGTILNLAVNKPPIFHSESTFCAELRAFVDNQQ
jgi:hypothetical protein